MQKVSKPKGNPSIARGMTPKGRPSVATGNKVSKRYNGSSKSDYRKGGCRKCKGG